jgi:hypothetical protein
MKLWQVAPLAVLAVSLPFFSACDSLGLGGGKSQEQEEYDQQVKAIEEQQKANEEYQKQQQEYYEQVQKALTEYYQQYYTNQGQQIQVIQGATGNQTGAPPVTVTVPPPETITVTSTPGG